MIDPDERKVALNVTISAAASLAVMIGDFLWRIRDETKYVWPRLRMSWSTRVYMLARYAGMASQIYNVYFAARMYLGIDASPLVCSLWFTYQAVVVQCLLLFVEFLLMHRVYALFLHNAYILVILISFALCQMASMGVSTRFSVLSNKHSVTCLMVKGNPGNVFFSATTMTTNLVIFFMTFSRYFRLPVKWTREGLGRAVLQDAMFSLSSISLIMLFLTLCSLEVIKLSMSGNITYYWLVCLLWISIGKIIVNHEKIPRDDGERGEGGTWRGTLQLTSQIEMGQSEWSLEMQIGSSDGHTPTTRTLQSPLSTQSTKTGEPSPLSACPSNGSREWFGDRPLPSVHRERHSPQPSSTVSRMEVSMRQPSQSNVCEGDGDAPQTEGHPWENADSGAHSPRPRLRPRPSNSELPPLEVSS